MVHQVLTDVPKERRPDPSGTGQPPRRPAQEGTIETKVVLSARTVKLSTAAKMRTTTDPVRSPNIPDNEQPALANIFPRQTAHPVAPIWIGQISLLLSTAGWAKRIGRKEKT